MLKVQAHRIVTFLRRRLAFDGACRKWRSNDDLNKTTAAATTEIATRRQ
jgi:hypothetical protein